MGTEGVNIEFTADGIRRIAEAAWQVNESTENIGAVVCTPCWSV